MLHNELFLKILKSDLDIAEKQQVRLSKSIFPSALIAVPLALLSAKLESLQEQIAELDGPPFHSHSLEELEGYDVAHTVPHEPKKPF